MVSQSDSWIVIKAYETEDCKVGGFAVIAAVDSINAQVKHPDKKFKGKFVIHNIPDSIINVNGKWIFLNERQMQRFAAFIAKKHAAGTCKIYQQVLRPGDVIYAYVIEKRSVKRGVK